MCRRHGEHFWAEGTTNANTGRKEDAGCGPRTGAFKGPGPQQEKRVAGMGRRPRPCEHLACQAEGRKCVLQPGEAIGEPEFGSSEPSEMGRLTDRDRTARPCAFPSSHGAYFSLGNDIELWSHYDQMFMKSCCDT